MTRAVFSFLVSLTLLSGCGEAEQPRFIPATGSEPAAIPESRRTGDKSSREATIPKNIETH